MDERVELPGSGRDKVQGAERVADAPADEEVLLTIVLRRRPGAQLPDDLASAPRAEARERLAAAAGADPADVDRVRMFLEEAAVEVVEVDPASRTIGVRTTVERANEVFGVSLGRYAAGDRTFRGREGAVRLPATVADAVVAVLGLDDRPQASASFKIGKTIPVEALPDPSAPPRQPRAPGAAAPVALWTTQVARLYDFPTDVDGTGQTIAIIELGGGYRDAELADYFERAGVPAPKVTSVAIDQGANHPGEDADGEVLLDIEVAGTVAPGARIVVYFADNSDRGFFDAVNRAVHDTLNAPAAVSISWGGPESSWTAQAMTAFDAALADADALGVTVLAAAGDHGAGDAAGDGDVHADFPSSSPHIVACGGTELIANGNSIAAETVWNEGDGWATGGGVSRQFPVPAYQEGMPIPDDLGRSAGTTGGRGVPDVAGNASSASGYIVLVDGSWTTVGGTSAVAPLYAGLVALLDQGVGRRVGLMLDDLYAAAGTAGVFRDITGGDNGVPASSFGPATKGYEAVPGWDACTGLGSISGSALLERLRGAAAPASA